MDMEQKNVNKSRSAPNDNDLTVFHEEQRAKKSNEVEHCLVSVSNTLQSIDKSVFEVKPLNDSNLTSVKQKTAKKSKRIVVRVIPVLILAIIVAGLALIPVLLFIFNTNTQVRSQGD